MAAITVNFTFNGVPNVPLTRAEFAQAIATGLQGVVSGSFLPGQEGGTQPTVDVGLWHPTGASYLEFYNVAAGKYLPIATVPTGVISLFGGTVAPDGWLLCNSSVVAQASYPQLFTAIGYNYSLIGTDGTQSADTTSLTSASQFRLPDSRSRFPVGSGQGTPNSPGGTNAVSPYSLGGRGGQESVNIKESNLPNPLTLQAAEYDSTGNQVNKALYGGNHYTSALYDIDSPNPSASTSASTNVPPYFVATFIIRT